MPRRSLRKTPLAIRQNEMRMKVRELNDEGLNLQQIMEKTGLSKGTASWYLRACPPPPIETMDRSVIPPDIPRQHQNYFLLVFHERGLKTANDWTRQLMADDA